MASRTLKAEPLSDIRIQRLRWLWAYRYKVRSLGLLAGWEGLGKSLITCWLAAQVTKGELPGELEGKPGNVITVASEDDFEDTIVPRLMAAGADLTRVYRVNAVTDDHGSLQLLPLR